jgi:flagellar motor protein MotB
MSYIRIKAQRKRRILKKSKETASQINLLKQTEQELVKKRTLESIKSMIDVKNMFQTVQSVIQAKNLPIKEKSRILRDHSLEIKPQFIEKKKEKKEDK